MGNDLIAPKLGEPLSFAPQKSITEPAHARFPRLSAGCAVSCSRLHFEMVVTVGLGEGGAKRAVESRKGFRVGFEVGAAGAARRAGRTVGKKVSGMPRIKVVPLSFEGGHPG